MTSTTTELPEPPSQLAGGPGGERQGEDVALRDVALEHVRDAKRDDAGLATSGPGDDEKGAVNGVNGLVLFGVESQVLQSHATGIRKKVFAGKRSAETSLAVPLTRAFVVI